MTPADLRPVDRLDVLVLIDNVTDSLSTTPKNVVPEWTGLTRAGRLPELTGAAICCAHHGLSLLVTTHVGDESHTMLFDAGPEGATLLRNATILGVDFGRVEAAVLSHGHWDHGGGLPTAIETIAKTRGRVDCFMHPGMFAQRGTRLADGTMVVQARPADPPRLAAAGANVVVTRDPQLIAGGTVYVTGEVPRVTPYEVGLPGHMKRGADGDWEPDPLIMDERFIAVRVKDRGVFVFSGCSHAGIVNVLTHAREIFTADPLYGVMGGFHLSGVNEKIIPDTVSDLTRFDLEFLAPGHCTGWRAMTVIAREFGDRLAPSAVGKRYAL
jgi:7,8-dihydropterin-6-yl-methyl-4-(beta-D-ribofuranosyl)aminobenzene 5'-phosphate synthase